MEKAEVKYFLDGEEVDSKLVNWEYSTGVTTKFNKVHIHYKTEDADKIYGNFSPEQQNASDIFKDILGSIFMQVSNLETSTENLVPEDGERYSETTEEVGVKFNNHKAPLDIVQTRQFPQALQALALATAFGNKKYEATDKDFLNFKRVPGGSQTYFDAAARHNVRRLQISEETGLPHLIHAVWNMMAALEICIEEHGIDMEAVSEEYLKNLHSTE